MTNISEAVVPAPADAQKHEEAAVKTRALIAVDSRMEQEMIGLHLKLEPMLPSPRTILFTASCAGEGVSTIVRAYGWVAANRFASRTLILDCSRREKGQKGFFNISNGFGWNDAARGLVELDGAIRRIGNSALYVSGYSSKDPALLADRSKINRFLATIQERFDLVLLDSPPATMGLDGINFMGGLDGVILVVEAEKTRWPIVDNTKNRILSGGNRILGLVMNKKRNHIPQYLYRRL